MEMQRPQTETSLTDYAGIDTWEDARILTALVDGQERAIAAVRSASPKIAAAATAMAERIRAKWKTDFSLATTGYLGPGGGDRNSTLGTVWIALASAKETQSKAFHFEHNRERSKERASQAALDLLRRHFFVSPK